MCLPAGAVKASSHREAPFITKSPKVDGSDFYIFNSYESGRTGFVTILANYQPLQDPAGGPNFYQMDPDALYEIMVDNNADGVEDITFQFQFQNTNNNVTLPVGTPTATNVPIPLTIGGQVTSSAGVTTTANINETEAYTLTVVTGGTRRAGTPNVIAPPSGSTFTKPIDNIGSATFGGFGASRTIYETYAHQYQYPFNMPTGAGSAACTGAAAAGKVFVGQRAEGFAVNLGTIFDLVGGGNATVKSVITGGDTRAHRGFTEPGLSASLAGTTPTNADANSFNLGLNSLGNKNVTTIALEVPAACLATSTDASMPGAIIGAWTTASVRQARVINPNGTFATPSKEGGAWAQVSRLGMPLVNEAVIGLKDKDLFNTSAPANDAQYAAYIETPVLPHLINLLYGGSAAADLEPQVFPRLDLVEAFAQGVPGVNQANPKALWEYQRLNTAIPVTPVGAQSSLGALGCFQNGVANLTYVDTTDTGTTAIDNSCDPSGFPNGRRPGDDITDITLRVAMGYLLGTTAAPNGNIKYTDYAINFDNQFGGSNVPNTNGAEIAAVLKPTGGVLTPGANLTTAVFPYLDTPYGGE